MTHETLSVERLFNLIETSPFHIILFVDDQDFCQKYAEFPWIQKEDVTVAPVTDDILGTFQIGKVPQFRFYLEGVEVTTLDGTHSYETFIERKHEVFGNVTRLQRSA